MTSTITTASGLQLIPMKERKDILEILDPFSPFDQDKGTYLMLKIASLKDEQIERLFDTGTLKIGEWLKDSRFAAIYNNMKTLACNYGRPARDLRAQYLDALLVECGIDLCQHYLKDGKLEKSSWNYLGKLVGLRMPVYANINSHPVQSGQDRLMEIMAPIFNDTGSEVVLEQKTQSVTIKRGEDG